MESLVHSFKWLSLFFLTISISISALHIPRLGIVRRTKKPHPQTVSSFKFSEDLKTFYYTQRLDHFNYRPDSYTTFQQRYMINFKYWGGAKSNAPIFAFFGAEDSLEPQIRAVGFLRDKAPKFNALIVYIEHRYYGSSIPFGSSEEAMRNASTLGYFNSAQALADYAEVLLQIKTNLSTPHSPIIVFGGSYGGRLLQPCGFPFSVLASWFRLKYPHIALGALASSAPILYFDGIAPKAGYYYVVTKDFRETSESCYQTIRKSWSVINKVAKKPGGLSSLSKRFKTCKKLSNISELEDSLNTIYATTAQYNVPPVHQICKAIDSTTKKTDILDQIFEGVVAYNGGPEPCYDLNGDEPPEFELGWEWQMCSEMVMPIGQDHWNESMFPPKPFNMTNFVEGCKSLYDILPQPHWVTTYYGGMDLKLVLHRFASNIIFSNGLKDPYSSGGVLENISDSVIALSTLNGSHCLDLYEEKSSDPEWLVMQRNTEIKIIKGWIDQYQADLKLEVNP